MKKTLSLFAGAVLALSVSMANADEPMTLTADQMDRVTAGGFGFVDVELIVTKFKDVFETINKLVLKEVNVTVNVDGFLADAEAGANCFGLNCVAETLTITDTRLDLLTATAYSESLSGTSPGGGALNGGQ